MTVVQMDRWGQHDVPSGNDTALIGFPVPSGCSVVPPTVDILRL